MKPTNRLMKEIKEAGLIYDPFVTASIISYEAGHLLRNALYAATTGSNADEQQLKAGWLANAKVELSDLITQCRILAEVYNWTWEDLINTGEAKLEERIETFKKRGVRPNETLLTALHKSMNDGNTFLSFAPRTRIKHEGD